jgi:hypothetical protein
LALSAFLVPFHHKGEIAQRSGGLGGFHCHRGVPGR